jgi:hypothetical protein
MKLNCDRPLRAWPRRETPVSVEWKRDVDSAFAEARSRGEHLLLDFNAAPL